MFQIARLVLEQAKRKEEHPFDWLRRTIPLAPDTEAVALYQDREFGDYLALAVWDGTDVAPFEDGSWVDLILHHVKRPLGEDDGGAEAASVVAFQQFQTVDKARWNARGEPLVDRAP